MMMTTRPELQGSFGMVASTHWLASAAGMSVLERGGNAFDAAAAAGFTLQIVEPHLNGPGGDLPLILWSAAEAAAHVVCGQGVSPAAATIEHFTHLGLNLVPGSGLLAATVPGAFGAWTTMLQRWGTWELADVLAPALHYAETGFPLLGATSSTIATVSDLFREHWSPSAATWLESGRVPAPGTWWRSPVVARTYRRVLSEAIGSTREARIGAAQDAWYRGFVAEAIGEFSTSAWRDTSGRDHAGLLTADDLARWQIRIEPPVAVDFAGRYEVLKTGPWGQGPVFLQQLRLLESVGLLDHEVRSAEWIHLITEAAKLAFADREAYYGDPLASDIPLDQLLSAEYADQRAKLIESTASLQLRPGSPGSRQPQLPNLTDPAGKADIDQARMSGSGEPTVGRLGQSRSDTCHVDVVDRWGNFVSATPSGGWLQSSPVIPELGFPLGSRAQMSNLDPGLPNTLRPGVRPRTTLSPSLAMRDGEPWMAFGTPGGDQQDQWQVSFFLDLVHADLRGSANIQRSIDAPMFHSTHFPSSFYPREARPGELLVESRIGEPVIAELRQRGHKVEVVDGWSLGRLSAVMRDGERLKAGANPRGAQGYAAGR